MTLEIYDPEGNLVFSGEPRDIDHNHGYEELPVSSPAQLTAYIEDSKWGAIKIDPAHLVTVFADLDDLRSVQNGVQSINWGDLSPENLIAIYHQLTHSYADEPSMRVQIDNDNTQLTIYWLAEPDEKKSALYSMTISTQTDRRPEVVIKYYFGENDEAQDKIAPRLNRLSNATTHWLQYSSAENT